MYASNYLSPVCSISLSRSDSRGPTNTILLDFIPQLIAAMSAYDGSQEYSQSSSGGSGQPSEFPAPTKVDGQPGTEFPTPPKEDGQSGTELPSPPKEDGQCETEFPTPPKEDGQSETEFPSLPKEDG